jgi:hypothetical protein
VSHVLGKLVKVAGATLVVASGGMLLARALGYELGPHALVRCRHGHLYTTSWIPGVKLKGIDFGIARYQYCPVGKHWSLAVPARARSVSTDERREAEAHHDLPIA